MRVRLCLYLLLLPLMGFGQDYTAAWEGYFSFYHIKALDAGNGKLYAASQNAIFTTELTGLAQEKITTLNGLSGDPISALHYIADKNALLIGYESGLIQLYHLDQGSVNTFIDVTQQPTITPEERQINGFYEQGDLIYIATNYGITKFNMINHEFGDTYYIGNNGQKLGVNAIALFNGNIIAATDGGGIRYAALNNPNIIDYNQWNQIGSGSYKNVFVFQQQVYALSQGNTLLQLSGGGLVNVHQFNQLVLDIKAGQDYLTATLPHQLVILDQNLQPTSIFSPANISASFTTGMTYQNQLFAGNETFGLLSAPVNDLVNYTFLSPNGPLRNDVFAMDNRGSELWVAFGAYDFYYNPYPLKKRGLSHLIAGQWINIPYEDLPQDRSITSVSINPNKPSQVFFCSFHDGLLEIEDNEVKNFYTTTNSDLEPTEHPQETPEAIRLGPAIFDSDGNLWMGSAMSSYGLLKLPKGGGANSFVKYDMSDMLSSVTHNYGFGSMVMDDAGNIYMASYRDGIIGFNPSTGEFAKLRGGEGQANLPSNYITSLAMDHNDQLWIGTTKGLRVLYGAANMFTNPHIQTHNIVFLDDQGVPQELFANLSITDIEVDGNNNKWIGSTAGVYYVSADGQQTIHHFTTENSPLPSNSINSIKIDGNSGDVFLATDKGLVAFHGKATTAAQNLEQMRAYPNPVRPHYEGVVTIDGLMKNTNVKITDIEGNLVYEEISEGGSIQWNTTAFGQYKVASGVYLVLATSADNTETKVTKIMIIR